MVAARDDARQYPRHFLLTTVVVVVVVLIIRDFAVGVSATADTAAADALSRRVPALPRPPRACALKSSTAMRLT